jgi:KDO2-lipid IV(A) lauroyltransferase
MVGLAGFWLIAKERRKALQSLNTAFGKEQEPAELKRIAIGAYRHLGRSFFELLDFYYYHRLNPEDFISIEGREYLDQGLRRGKGVIFVSAHLGNWELLPLYTASLGYPASIIARRISNDGINDFMLKFRQQTGVRVILLKRRGKVGKDVFRALADNRILGVLMDQDSRVDGVFVNFFGRLAYTPGGPVALALATGAAIVPGFIIRDSKGCHQMKLLPPYELKITGNKQKDILVNTQTLTGIIEEYVRKFPAQWVWMHQRWRRQPKIG